MVFEVSENKITRNFLLTTKKENQFAKPYWFNSIKESTFGVTLFQGDKKVATFYMTNKNKFLKAYWSRNLKER